MPSLGGYNYPDESRRVKAWQHHYMAKGCTATKANQCARNKVWKKSTWPPERAKEQS